MPWTCTDCGTVKTTSITKTGKERFPSHWERWDGDVLCYRCGQARWAARQERWRREADERARKREEERAERERRSQEARDPEVGPWSKGFWQRAFEEAQQERARRQRQAALRVLGLAESFTAEDLQNAYRRRAFRCHPDRGGTAASFREVTEARNLLLQTLLS
jgi:hypothetical protein